LLGVRDARRVRVQRRPDRGPAPAGAGAGREGAVTANSTDILRTPICPALPPDFAGVRIAAAPRPLRTSPLVIHGAYRIPWADADPIAPPRHRALVLVVTSGSHCFA